MIRSASQITQNFNTLFDIQRYFYPILLRLIGAGNILVQAAARAEMPQREAEDLLSVVLQFLKDLAPRSSTATIGHSNLCALATAFGELFQCRQSLSRPSSSQSDLHSSHIPYQISTLRPCPRLVGMVT